MNSLDPMFRINRLTKMKSKEKKHLKEDFESGYLTPFTFTTASYIFVTPKRRRTVLQILFL